MRETKFFAKGSEEWMMFTDYWNLCKKYWIVEPTDKYWENVISDFGNFTKKYNSEFAIKIALAFLDTKENEYRKERCKA